MEPEQNAFTLPDEDNSSDEDIDVSFTRLLTDTDFEMYIGKSSKNPVPLVHRNAKIRKHDKCAPSTSHSLDYPMMSPKCGVDETEREDSVRDDSVKQCDELTKERMDELLFLKKVENLTREYLATHAQGKRELSDDDESIDEDVVKKGKELVKRSHKKKKKGSDAEISKKSDKKKDDDSSEDNTKNSRKKPPKKSNKKIEKKKTKPDTDDDSDDDDDNDDEDEDEDIKKVNRSAKKVAQFKSMNELVVKKFYKVLDLEAVTTSKGDSIRVKIADPESEDGTCFFHLPKRVIDDLVPLIPKFLKLSKSKKGLYFQFRGVKGLSFKFRFSTKPN